MSSLLQDGLCVLAALAAIGLPLALVRGLLGWQQRRRDHARMRR